MSVHLTECPEGMEARWDLCSITRQSQPTCGPCMPGMCVELTFMFYFALFKMEFVVWGILDRTAQAQTEALHFLVFRVT